MRGVACQSGSDTLAGVVYGSGSAALKHATSGRRIVLTFLLELFSLAHADLLACYDSHLHAELTVSMPSEATLYMCLLLLHTQISPVY